MSQTDKHSVFKLDAALRSSLHAALGERGFVDDPDVVAAYRNDQTIGLDAGEPAAVVRPRTAGEVAAVVKLCEAHSVSVVVRGAGTGLAGGANAVDGCVVLCTEQMTTIVEVDDQNLTATVQPGVLNGDLLGAARAAGLWYAPDPASRMISSIGGNIATNAGGLCCVREGTTRDHVLELEVALTDGRLVRIGRRTVKGVAGYDLTSHIVGSEGTLGIVTEATVRLVPPPVRQSTIVATFATLNSAAAAVSMIIRSLRPTMLELMDRTTLAAVEDMAHMGLEADALLLIQVDLTATDDLEAVRACCATGAAELHVTADPDEAESLMAVRRLAFPALERQGVALLDDICVPRSQLAAVIAGIEAISARHAVTIGTFGHAGDGNLHPTLVVPRDDPETMRRAQVAFGELLGLARTHGGTISGEHGVGRLKRPYLQDELDPVAVELHTRIKHAWDPSGVLPAVM